MTLRKLGIFISLVAVANCLFTTDLLSVNANAASPSQVTIKQQSQIAFLMTDGRMPNGSPPTYAQSLKVVLTYPSVPTLAEYKSLGISSPTAHALQVQEIPFNVSQKGHGKDIKFASGWYQWAHGLFGNALGWNQNLSYNYNPERNTIWNRSTKGYPFITWEGFLWRWSGEYTSDGYPNWITGGGGKNLAWIAYNFIEIFEAGWGPITVPTQFNMVIVGYSNGTILGGQF
ncbi:MAG TPA: hypothetical protein VMQ52_02745 [Candidatus Saccharimonadales bacterium]|jgi:hypothetical protein|nr:hypothetical protein [Candidatus Saccharimonadales bacterium]